jgi:hypothetical protein
VEIKPISKGTEIPLGIEFKPTTAEVTSAAAQDLRRLARMVKGNANRKFLIDVALHGYLKDSLKSNPDLTELVIDTIHFLVERKVPDTLRLDSILTVMNKRDSIQKIKKDSTTALTSDEYFYNQMDSLRKIAYKIMRVDSTAIKKTYHNDRTKAQAKTLINYLINDGANPANITHTNSALPEPNPEKRKISVVVKVIE